MNGDTRQNKVNDFPGVYLGIPPLSPTPTAEPTEPEPQPSFIFRILASEHLSVGTFFTFMMGAAMFSSGLIATLGSGGIGLAPAALLIGGGASLMAVGAASYYSARFFTRNNKEKPTEPVAEKPLASEPTEEKKHQSASFDMIRLGRSVMGLLYGG